MFKGELIGQKIKILESKNSTLKNITGKIIDETKHTITIKTKTKTKMIQKNQIIFQIDNQVIEGNKIISRPEDRIKK